MRTRHHLPVFFTTLVVAAGCGTGNVGGDHTAPVGSDGGACYPNHTCNIALSCDDAGICVADVADGVVLTWEPPTTNTDDSPLTDLAGYRLYWGTSTSAYSSNQDLGMPSCADVAGTMTCTYTLAGLGAGSYFFAVTAYNTGGYESVYSNEATKTL